MGSGIVKLPAHRGASRKGNLIYIVPLDPACKAGLAGHLPVKSRSSRKKILPRPDVIGHFN